MSARFFDFLRAIPWAYPVGRGPLSSELCALSCVTVLQWKGLATPPLQILRYTTLQLKIAKCWMSRKPTNKHGFTFCKKELPKS